MDRPRLVRFQIGTFLEGHMGGRPIAARTGTRISRGARSVYVDSSFSVKNDSYAWGCPPYAAVVLSAGYGCIRLYAVYGYGSTTVHTFYALKHQVAAILEHKIQGASLKGWIKISLCALWWIMPVCDTIYSISELAWVLYFDVTVVCAVVEGPEGAGRRSLITSVTNRPVYAVTS